MKRTQKSLLLLGGLAAASAGLTLYAFKGVKEPQERQAERRAAEERLFPVPAAGRKADADAPRFTRIRVDAQGQSTTLEREEGGWRVVSPVEARADTIAAEGLVSHLQNARFKTVVEESPTPEDLKRYGLMPPQFTVTARAELPQGGEQTVTLLGGVENTFDGSVYMRRDGDPRVYAAEGGVRYALQKGTSELRDKEVLTFEEPKLAALEVKGPGHRYRLERDAAGSWHLTEPRRMEADSATIKSMLSELKKVRAQAFPADTPEERRRLGLQTPRLEAVFTPKEGERVRLRLSQHTEEGTARTFVLKEEAGTSLLTEVSDRVLGELEKSPEQLRDRSVLHFKTDEVAELVFSPGGGAPPLVVKRVRAADAGVSEEWQVAAPRSGPARKYKVSSLLWSLKGLKASAVGEENPKTWDRYGVSEGGRSVALHGADGKLLARLWLGKEVPQKSGILYARGSRAQVVEVDASRLSELPTGVEELLEGTSAPR
jgi:hypothetical protein